MQKVTASSVRQCQKTGLLTVHEATGRKNSTVLRYQKTDKYITEWKENTGHCVDDFVMHKEGQWCGSVKMVMSFLNFMKECEEVSHNMYNIAKAYVKLRIDEMLTKKDAPLLEKSWIGRLPGQHQIERVIKDRDRAKKQATFTEEDAKADATLSEEDQLSIAESMLAAVKMSTLSSLQTSFSFRALLAMANRSEQLRFWKLTHCTVFTIDRQTPVLSFKNLRGKTETMSEPEYSSMIPHRNPLLCATGLLGLSLLHRFKQLGETFPSVRNPEAYCKIPLVRSSSDERSGIRQCAMLQSFKVMLDELEGAEQNDPITHLCRHQAQFEAQAHGVSTDDIDKALNYSKEKKQGQGRYSFQTPLSWLHQRAGYNPLDPEDHPAHMKALLSESVLLDEMIDTHFPFLREQDIVWESMREEVDSKCDGIRTRKERIEAKKKMRYDLKLRKSGRLLKMVRHLFRVCLSCMASRPRHMTEGSILMESAPIFLSFIESPSIKWMRSLFGSERFVSFHERVIAQEFSERELVGTPRTRKIAVSVKESLKDTFSDIKDTVKGATNGIAFSVDELARQNGLERPPLPPTMVSITCHSDTKVRIGQDKKGQLSVKTIPVKPVSVVMGVPIEEKQLNGLTGRQTAKERTRQEQGNRSGYTLCLSSLKSAEDVWKTYAEHRIRKRGSLCRQTVNRLSHVKVLAKEIAKRILKDSQTLEEALGGLQEEWERHDGHITRLVAQTRQSHMDDKETDYSALLSSPDLVPFF